MATHTHTHTQRSGFLQLMKLVLPPGADHKQKLA